MTLSKNRLKYIKSLDLKKNRKSEGVFIAEGPKLVGELLSSDFHCKTLFATSSYHVPHFAAKVDEFIEVTTNELFQLSLQKNPQDVIGIFKQRTETWDLSLTTHSLCLGLDDIQDPGNLGTIVRLADWFGIEHIFCSENSVDIFNPKAIQASMGGIAHVHIHYVDLPKFLSEIKNTPIYGTFLEGENIYEKKLSDKGIIIMGNEGKGISREVKEHITDFLNIPSFPVNRKTTESLNVAVATAIVCSEFRRKSNTP